MSWVEVLRQCRPLQIPVEGAFTQCPALLGRLYRPRCPRLLSSELAGV